MLSAFDLSSRVQELRLAWWAQHRNGLTLPPELSKEEGFNKIQFLADLLIHHDLKQSGFFYILEYDDVYGRFNIEVPGIANLVDLACVHNIPMAQTYFPPPRKEHPYIQVFMYHKGIYFLDQQLDELRHDLQIYRDLQTDIDKLAPALDTLSKQEKWEQELSRHLRWNRLARQARTPVEMQRNLVEEQIRFHTPTPQPPDPTDQPEESTTPVRVEVQQGQTLQEAIFLALHGV